MVGGAEPWKGKLVFCARGDADTVWAGAAVWRGDPVEDENGEEDVCVAAHHANPARLSLEGHKDGDVDNARGEGCAATEESTESNGAEGSADVVAKRGCL